MLTPAMPETTAHGNGASSCPTKKEFFATQQEAEDFEKQNRKPLAPSIRRQGKWRLSPLREAGVLLGVLKREGLTGKGIVKAFEKWAPRIVGASRANIGRLYREQTGREMADHILIQKADKVVRYRQLPAEIELVRRVILRSRRSVGKREDRRVAQRNGAKRQRQFPVVYRVRVEVRSDDINHDATVLVAALNGRGAAERARSEVAELFGVPAKAVRDLATEGYRLEDFLVINGYVMEKGRQAMDKEVGRG